MKPSANTACRPSLNDVLYDGPAVSIVVVLTPGHVVLNTPHVGAVRPNIPGHGDIFEIPQIHCFLGWVSKRLFLTLGLCPLEPHHAAKVGILERHDHVRIETQYVAVADTVGNAVAMQLVTEHHGRSREALIVLLVIRRAR